MRLAARAVTTRLGPMMPMLMQVTEGGHAGVDGQDDIAARPAVSSIGAAPRDVGLATE
jgi:hypothetical protein